MKTLIFLITFNLCLFSASTNHFFIMGDNITLECKDIDKINKIDDSMATFYYSKSGIEKIYNFTKNNKNKKLGLIADNSLIFMNINIREPLGEN